MKFFLPALCLLATGCLGLPDLPALASGADMAARDDGNNIGIGDLGDLGDLGDTEPMPKWVQLTAGESHACALDADGDLYCWGANNFGQLGLGDTKIQVGAALVPRETAPWEAVAAGEAHTCAVAGGNVYCWGRNQSKQVGSADESQLESPTLVEFSAEANILAGAAVGAGVAHSCVQTDEAVRCWGLDLNSRLGEAGPAATGVVGIPLRDISLGETFGCGLGPTTGSLECWGTILGGSSPTAEQITSGVDSLSMGVDHGCAVTMDGGVTCFGSNDSADGNIIGIAKLGHTNASPEPRTVIDGDATVVAAGWDHTCAVISGEVKCWGQDSKGETGRDDDLLGGSPDPVDVPMLPDVTAVAAGDRFTCAIAGADVYCWGTNEAGQLGRGSSNTGHNYVPDHVRFPSP